MWKTSIGGASAIFSKKLAIELFEETFIKSKISKF
jgi:hypothetical protein